ncbi:chitin synthase-domain-containing protein [Phlyctochytrium arcticum]|nr:chitin synthase-domain-containing protein [Phlyctochytrium arcticum]
MSTNNYQEEEDGQNVNRSNNSVPPRQISAAAALLFPQQQRLSTHFAPLPPASNSPTTHTMQQQHQQQHNDHVGQPAVRVNRTLPPLPPLAGAPENHHSPMYAPAAEFPTSPNADSSGELQQHSDSENGGMNHVHASSSSVKGLLAQSKSDLSMRPPSGMPLPPTTSLSKPRPNDNPIPNYTDVFPARFPADTEHNAQHPQTPGTGEEQQQPRRQTTLRRQHTLTRPERQRSTRRAMLRPPNAAPPPARAGATSLAVPPPAGGRDDRIPPEEYVDNDQSAIWKWFARIVTCCFFPPCLRACGKRDRAVQQAWREKVALCMIIVTTCGLVAFLTIGLQRVLCPESNREERVPMFNRTTNAFLPGGQDWIIIAGYEYQFAATKQALATRGGFTLGDEFQGRDITPLFNANQDGACGAYFPGNTCTFPDSNLISPDNRCADRSWLTGIRRRQRFMEWEDLANNKAPPNALTVFNGAAFNLTGFFADPQQQNNPALPILRNSLGKDGTFTLNRRADTQVAIRCLARVYHVGYVGEETIGCISSTVIQNVSLIVILGVVLARFFMAIWFHWFGSPNLYKSRQNRQQGASASPRASQYIGPYGNSLAAQEIMDDDMYTILLVTCYSEGKEGIKGTLDALARTDHPDDRKLLFIVADGLITGHGNDMSTPDMIISLMEQDSSLPPPEPKSYIAIADGVKQHNMARVHAGYYVYDGHRVPMIAVVKCGTPPEASQPKPGNRGKRDSQLVVMNFLSRTLFNDRMTALDYELFYRIQHIATTADKYEAILMVDADTNVAPDSLGHMVAAFQHDKTIMGLCGETRIANKTASFTTAIQVFEYYISHHLGKAFESVFGGVTCLPGCFCMYRIKAPKGNTGTTVPILTNPNIVEEYSENVVDTLHKKNLLLLGEDRFLTTLMLRTFPHRKMVFVPQAKCWTMVPDQFRVLLSQRRRWINSTVHNLMELVLVRDLCGTFCFSMQFVILMELIGTVVLPAAICLTLYLCISAIIIQTAELIPFLMLAAILGLPGILIIVTTRKMAYVGWMFVYLLSLPIWNFVLPSYAYWHFDDFSWGETRKVEGEQKGDDHGGKDGHFDSSAVIMKKWAEWERDRTIGNRFGPSGEKSPGYPNMVPAHFRASKVDNVYSEQATHSSYDPRVVELGPGIFGGHGSRASTYAPSPHALGPPHPPWAPRAGSTDNGPYPPLLMGGLPRPPSLLFPPGAHHGPPGPNTNLGNRPMSAALFPRSEADRGHSYEMTAPRPQARLASRSNGSTESFIDSTTSSGSSSHKGKQVAP